MTMDIRKSGRNLKLGMVATTHDAFRTLVVTPDVEAEPMSPNTLPCFQVLLIADQENQARIWFGRQGNPANVPIAAGGSVSIPINDANKICVRAENATDIVYGVVME